MLARLAWAAAADAPSPVLSRAIICGVAERAPAKSPDEELVLLAQKGDRQAFEELIKRHQQKAFRIAFDFARDREEAKDLSQEAFCAPTRI